MPVAQVQEFVTNAQPRSTVIKKKPRSTRLRQSAPRPVTAYVSQRKINEGTSYLARHLVGGYSSQVTQYGSMDKVRRRCRPTPRNGHVTALGGDPLPDEDKENDLSKTRRDAERASQEVASKRPPSSMPRLWVRYAVAIALGLGTMIGWKRIVSRSREDRKTH